MRFVKQGKTYQLVIENGIDLEGIQKLDEALWVAMSAPVSTFQFDPKFLQFVNANHSGHISSNEIKDACAWLLDQLPDHQAITKEFSGTIALKDINEKNEIGPKLLASAKYILNDLEIADKDTITLEIIRKFQDVVKQRPLNGDGIISLNATTVSEIPNLKEFVTDAVAATGGTPDVDGTQGVSNEQYQEFYNAITPYLAWLKKAEIPAGETKTDLMPFGADTLAMKALLLEHADEIERFYQLSKLLDFDARLNGKVLSTDGKLGTFDPANAADVLAYQNSLPLACPNANCLLPLDPKAINPSLRSWFQNLVSKVISVLLPGATTMSEDDWGKVKAAFAAFDAYQADKQGAICAGIPTDRLQKYLDTKGLLEECAELAKRDALVTDTLTAAAEVERLLLYRANLISLVNNFVSFPELYSSTCRAKFERGSAVFDGRWFHVSFPVDNLAAHSAVAKNSNLFVIYVEVEMGPGKKELVAIPVTTGRKGNLAVGKQGVFFDLQNHEHIAKIVQIIENPVCFSEALVAPFVKLGKMMESKVEGWAGSSETAFQGTFDKAVTDPKAIAAAAPAPAPAPAPQGKSDKSGAILGLSVAFAAVGSTFAYISKTVSGMSATAIWVSVLCAILALLLPISLLAILKLRRQDLSSLLEGNGWAINARMRMGFKQRAAFSRHGIFPDDAEGTPKARFRYILLVLVLIVIILLVGWRLRYQIQNCQACPEDECTTTEAVVPAEAPAAEAPAEPAAE